MTGGACPMPVAMLPEWNALPLRCKPCGHEWQDWLPGRVPASVLIAAMKAMRCPECGSRKLLIINISAEATP